MSYIRPTQKYWGDVLVWFDIKGIAIVVGCIVILLPDICQVNVIDISENQFMKSIYSLFAASCSLCICLPLIVDAILDLIQVNTVNYQHLNIRIISLCCLSLFNITVIVVAMMQNDHYLALVNSLDRMQLFVELSLIMWLLVSLDGYGVYTNKRSIIYMTLVCLSFANSIVFKIPLGNNTINVALEIFGILCFASIIIQLAVLTICWLREFFARRKRRIASGFSGEISFEEYYCCVVLFFQCFFVFSFPIALYTLSYNHFLLALFFLRILTTFFICLLPSRIFRMKSLEYKLDSELKNRIVKYLSHEMRTPIGVISMGLDNLCTRIMEGADLKELLELVEEVQLACSHSGDVLDHLLLYEKVDKETFTPKQQQIPVMSFICGALRSDIALVSKRAASIRVLRDIDSSQAERVSKAILSVDCSLLNKQLLHLLKRALVHSTAESPVKINAEVVSIHDNRNMSLDLRRGTTGYNRGRVNPAYFVADELLRITITTGSRLTEEEKCCFIERVLPIERKANGVDADFTLGIWLLNKIVLAHGGKAGFLSGEIQDVLYVDLPFSDSSIEPRDHPLIDLDRHIADYVNRNINKDEQEVTMKGMNVLVVDDSKVIRKMLTTMMRSLGHRCMEADDGTTAVEVIAKTMSEGTTCDVILLDNEMPKLRGRDAAKEIRKMNYKGLIIGVTGNALNEDIEDFKAMGVDEVLLKPLTRETFVTTLDKLTKP